MSVGNSCLSLVLKDLYNAGSISSMPRKFFIAFTPPNLSLNVFGARNPPVCFVKGTHLSPL